jgi:hypothetical protein
MMDGEWVTAVPDPDGSRGRATTRKEREQRNLKTYTEQHMALYFWIFKIRILKIQNISEQNSRGSQC